MPTRRLLPALLSAALLAALWPPAGARPSPGGDAPPPAAAGDWPWWRGPRGDNTSPDAVPDRWGATENVVWKAAVSGRGHSSPAVCGPHVFLTTADEAARTQSVLAYDRAAGKLLWSTVAHTGPLPKLNPKNSHASATPACDGERVYAAFLTADGLSVTATDLAGAVVWQTKAGAFGSEHGYGSSPVVCGPLVVVNGDNLTGSFVAALDRRTGKVAWRADRPTTGRHGSYATPAVARLAGRDQLLLTGMGEVTAYDPATGERLWRCDGPAEVTGCTPAFGDGLVFATGGFPEKAVLAIRAAGRGDVTATHVAWRTAKGVAYVPSPLYHAGRLYVVADNGVITCAEAASGAVVWQDRLRGAFTSSPVLAADRVLVTNEAGTTFVLKAGPAFAVVAENDLGDGGGLATPAVAGGRLFVRTARHLYCVGTPAGR